MPRNARDGFVRAVEMAAQASSDDVKAHEMAVRPCPWCRQGARNGRSGLPWCSRALEMATRAWPECCQSAQNVRLGIVLCSTTGSKLHAILLFEEPAQSHKTLLQYTVPHCSCMNKTVAWAVTGFSSLGLLCLPDLLQTLRWLPMASAGIFWDLALGGVLGASLWPALSPSPLHGTHGNACIRQR